MFDARTLDYFLVTIEHGSIRAAALALGVSQPALTKAIRRLEHSFGAPLFDRASHGVRPTVYGSAVLRHARSAKAALDSAFSTVEALRSGSDGLIRVGADKLWHNELLARAIGIVREIHPNLKVAVVTGSDQSLRAELIDGGLDLALSAIPDLQVVEQPLEWTTLVRTAYTVVVGATHPLFGRDQVQAAELLAHKWVLPPMGAPTRQLLERSFQLTGLPGPIAAIETELTELGLELVEAGGYLGYHLNGHPQVTGTAGVVPVRVDDLPACQCFGGVIVRRDSSGIAGVASLKSALVSVCGALPQEAA